MREDANSLKGRQFADQLKNRVLSLLVILTLLLGFALIAKAAETNYPKKKIDWIVPFPPGGGYDMYSRAIAKTLPKYLPNKVNIIVKNVSGAGGRRGAAVLYRSKPDGYTIGILNPLGLATNDFVKKSTQFNIFEYTYLATCSRGIGGILVAAHSKFKSIEDLQKAEKVKFATGGRGSGSWLSGILVKQIMGVPVHMVSGYLGTKEYITALLRKDADAVALGHTDELISYCRGGEIKVLMTFSREPWELMPSVPTLRGTPYEELADFLNDRVIAGPPGLPDEIAGILENSLSRALHDPDLQAWSKKTDNPLFILGAIKTVINLKENMVLIRKYEKFFKD